MDGMMMGVKRELFNKEEGIQVEEKGVIVRNEKWRTKMDNTWNICEVGFEGGTTKSRKLDGRKRNWNKGNNGRRF